MNALPALHDRRMGSIRSVRASCAATVEATGAVDEMLFERRPLIGRQPAAQIAARDILFDNVVVFHRSLIVSP
jgi:hypothetical protein